MAMPKFEPVATREWDDRACKYQFCTDGNDEEFLFTEKQLTAAYEAGKLDGASELREECGRKVMAAFAAAPSPEGEAK